MRELTVRIRFTTACLGNVRPGKVDPNRLLMPRDPMGRVVFMVTWHRANMILASAVLGKHQDEVLKILWDSVIEGRPGGEAFRRYWSDPSQKSKKRQRYTPHEAFFPNQIIGIHCVVPPAISDEDLWRLMDLAGRFKGLSPFRPGDFGHFSVESVRPRRRQVEVDRDSQVTQEPKKEGASSVQTS